MTRNRIAPLAVVLAAAVLWPIAPVDAQDSEGKQPTAFERIAALAGEWDVLDSEDQPTALRVKYEVVANGNAVVETHFGGTADETVTLYHQEDGLVTATQLSSRQRPARLVPGAGGDDQSLLFENDGTTEETGRLLGVGMTWLEDGNVRLTWTHSGTDDDETLQFEMRRALSIEELVAEAARLRSSLDTLQARIDAHVKSRVVVSEKGRPPRRFDEIKTFPLDAGWNHSGIPFRLHMANQTKRFASTFASAGDQGHTIAHYPFKAGKGCRVRFSVLGGHGYIAVVLESRAPPRKIGDIPGFSAELLEGTYGEPVERIVGGRWESHPRAVDWDLSRYEGKTLRLYVVDAESNHYGQVSISEIHISEEVDDDR